MKWTPEIIEYMSESRLREISWKEIADNLSDIHQEKIRPEACRAQFEYYKDRTPDITVYKEKQEKRADNKFNKRAIQSILNQEDFLEAIESAIANIGEQTKHLHACSDTLIQMGNGTPMTCEILFSDLQIGKKSADFSTPVAIKRIKEFARASMVKIQQHIDNGYNMERLLIVFLGDIIESSKKHADSPYGTDSSTTEQIQNAIEYIYKHFLEPILHFANKKCIKNVDIIGLAGNHDHDGHGIPMSNPGKQCYTWVIYKTLQMLTHNHPNVSWHIPEGYTANTEIYGHIVTYEHGFGIKCDEKSMRQMKAQRMDQLRKHITFFRMGDKHNVSRFDSDTLVCNGAFFGFDSPASEYSGILGFSAVAAQMVFFYVPRKDNRLPLYDSFMVQLQHVV